MLYSPSDRINDYGFENLIYNFIKIRFLLKPKPDVKRLCSGNTHIFPAVPQKYDDGFFAKTYNKKYDFF